MSASCDGENFLDHRASCPFIASQAAVLPSTDVNLFVLVRRVVATLHERRSCEVVVTAAAAKEHQGHKAASDDKRKEGAEAKSDPAMFGHGNLIARGPHRSSPDDGQDKYCSEYPEQNELAAT